MLRDVSTLTSLKFHHNLKVMDRWRDKGRVYWYHYQGLNFAHTYLFFTPHKDYLMMRANIWNPYRNLMHGRLVIVSCYLFKILKYTLPGTFPYGIVLFQTVDAQSSAVKSLPRPGCACELGTNIRSHGLPR